MDKQHSRATDSILERLDAVQRLASEIANAIKESDLKDKFSIEKTKFGYQIKHIGKPKKLAKDVGDLAADLVWHGNHSIIDTIDARNDKVTVLEALVYKLSREGDVFLYNAGDYQGHTLVSAIPQIVKKKIKPNGNAIASVNFDNYVSQNNITGIPTTMALAWPIIGMAKRGQGRQQEGEIGSTPEELRLTSRAPKSVREDLIPQDSYGNVRAPANEEQLKEFKKVLENTISELETGKVNPDDIEKSDIDNGASYAERISKSKNPASTLGENYNPRTGKELTSEELRRKQQQGIGGAYLSEEAEAEIEKNKVEQTKRDSLGLGKPVQESLEERIEKANIIEFENDKRKKRNKLITYIGVAGTVATLGLGALFGGGILKPEPKEPQKPGPDNPDKPIDPTFPDWTYKTDIAPSLNHITDKTAITGQTILVPMHVADADIEKYGDKIDRTLRHEDTKLAIKSSKGGNDTGAFEISFDKEGNYLLNASVKDKVGKEDYQTFWANVTNKPDQVNEKPEITSVRITPTGKPGEHILSVTATDKDTGVGGIEILLDGKNYNTTNTDSFEKIISEKDFEPGNYVFSAVAWDADDINLKSENNPTADFHANFPPTIDIAVKNIGGD
ncbi:MAG: hypothetical protein AABW84_02415, partial [Nanoarchaeota archaeon]